MLSFGRVIPALQCSSAIHLGVDNLNVVRHVSRILDGRVACRPFELTSGGDLLTVVEKMILRRGIRSVRISKVKGHADDDMVAVGRVRVEDRVGNDLADRLLILGDVESLIWLWVFVGVLVSCRLGASSLLCCYCSCCC